MDPYTNFHRHAIFVPVMYKIASSSIRNHSELYHSLNEPIIRFKIDSISKDNVLKLVKDQEEIIPAQRFRGNEVIIDLPKQNIKAGFYNVFYQEEKLGTLSFNSGSDESQLEQWEIKALRSQFASADHVTIFNSKTADSFSKELKDKYQGVPLWKYALILALIFLLAEVLLIRFL